MSKSDEVPDKGSNADEAYEAIVQRLRLGKIGRGDRIVDTVIAAELNMSRMPAREALLRLVNEGYLVGSTRGFRLPELTQADVLEIFEIRKILEPRAAALAAVALTPDQLEQLESAFFEARAGFETGNAQMMFDANVRFRNAWLNAVPNRRLVAMIERFFDQVNAVRIATLHDAESRQLSIAIGETLLAGFRRGDSLYVFEQMYSFVEAARAKFVALNSSGATKKARAVK
ncbi:GntR family transcriptional regulator [Sphingobium sp.]|uniref:GntR family transcriptional regulator n=1 Tax=Sphingobium sp. TaxID=1912891 RepID=UPI00262CD88E|nr:GntR family transcriptional regulator [Sphingobium sp.]